MTGKVKHSIEIKIWNISNPALDLLLDSLGVDILETNQEYDEESGVDVYEIDAEETASYFYAPAVMYLNNGDPGYPEEYEDELLYYDTSDLSNCIRDWLHTNNLTDVEFECSVGENVTLDDDYADYD